MATLNWIGKEAVVNHDRAVPFKLLKKVKSASVGTSQNLIVHGDNLEALKALMPYYVGKIKCIYIDPPYNTGHEGWVYNDKVNSPKIREWLKQTVKLDDLTRHDKWLCMMYPRLRLLRDLLTEDGVIFISIDENEVHNLRNLCDEIFNENNFSGDIIWKNSSKNDQSYVSTQHEYILSYVKDKNRNIGAWREKKEGLEEIYRAFEGFKKKHGNNWRKIHEEALNWYKQFPASNPLFSSKHYSWMDERGVYFPADISGPNYGQYRYDLRHPKTGKTCKAPASGWRYPEKTMLERVKNNLIHFGEDETKIPNNKTYLKDTEFQSLTSVKYRDGRVGSQQLSDLMGDNIFTNPKDIDILKLIFKAVGVRDGDIILDSFAGSGTTGHAVLDLNKEDGSNRQFILVEMEDAVAKKITAERVKRAIKKYGYKDGFEYCELDKPLFDENGQIEETCDFKQFATYIYFTETQTNIDAKKIKGNFIGALGETEYYLLYKGKLQNDLDKSALKIIADTEKKKVIYADRCLLDDDILAKHCIVFKQIPYEVKVY